MINFFPLIGYAALLGISVLGVVLVLRGKRRQNRNSLVAGGLLLVPISLLIIGTVVVFLQLAITGNLMRR